MRLGIDRLAADRTLSRKLEGKRVGLVCHPASIASSLVHSVDVVGGLPGVTLAALLGPQHGFLGDKQDNMVETDDDLDPNRGIPIYSLYGEVRRPTAQMFDGLDVVLVDLQDVGTRIYTFLTTLLYVMEAAAELGQAVWVLDRPNPAGRPVEGTLLRPGFESFVGAGPLPMRHGLTLGEAARWFKAHFQLDLDLEVVAMEGYDPAAGPGFGWPVGTLPWVNPSPNAASLNMARAYPGSVILEGTTLSEGRGTTTPLEMVGAPGLPVEALLDRMHILAPDWMAGAWVRPCVFEPTFHKHAGEPCSGLQWHTDWSGYDHGAFRPYRAFTLFLKALRQLRPDYPIWREHAYEYTSGSLPIDYIDGGPELREWVDDPSAEVAPREAALRADEAAWEAIRAPYLLY